MSLGMKVPHAAALDIARQLIDDLTPHVARAKVAGSLRRRRPLVSDIEIVVEPRMSADLFGGQLPEIEPIRTVANSWGVITKGGDRMIQVQTAMQDVKVDLFIVHPPANWYVILAIRTGPAILGQWAVTRMRDHGRRCDSGRLLTIATGAEWPVDSEEDFFAAAGLPCLPPSKRDLPEAMRPITQNVPVRR